MSVSYQGRGHLRRENEKRVVLFLLLPRHKNTLWESLVFARLLCQEQVALSRPPVRAFGRGIYTRKGLNGLSAAVLVLCPYF